MNIDIDRLRRDLIDYFGSAMNYNPLAIIELTKVERATPQELINIAISNNIDLDDYIINDFSL